MRPPQSWQRARATLGVAGLIAVVWLGTAVSGFAEVAPIWGGFIPGRAAGLPGNEILAPFLLTPLTATLIHAGAVHLIFNLLMLLFCGRSVENILGAPSLLILFVVGAYVAAAAHFLVGPGDATPMVGASGAISAVVGAYAMLFGRNRVRIANPTIALLVNAAWLAAAWIGLQLMIGITFTTAGARIAIAAHIGGFLAGLLLTKPLLIFRYRRA